MATTFPTDPNSMTLPALAAMIAGHPLASRLIDLARDEDLGAAGDITSLCCVSSEARAVASLNARTAGMIAGLAFVPLLVDRFGADIAMELHAADADRVPARTRLATLRGRTRDLLGLERTLLNLVSRLSGVATRTAEFVAAIPAGVRAHVYDTRKTTPGLRLFEKYAVRCGGGRCHRMGLHDAVLIKDNHIAGVRDLARFVAEAASRARAGYPPPSFIEVEVESLDQFRVLLALAPGTIDMVLLDNMGAKMLREAAALRDEVNPRLQLEASGGVTLETIGEIARTGVDRISAGSITYHAVGLDLALDFE